MATDDDPRSRKREREEEEGDSGSTRAVKRGTKFLEAFMASSRVLVIPENVTSFEAGNFMLDSHAAQPDIDSEKETNHGFLPSSQKEVVPGDMADFIIRTTSGYFAIGPAKKTKKAFYAEVDASCIADNENVRFMFVNMTSMKEGRQRKVTRDDDIIKVLYINVSRRDKNQRNPASFDNDIEKEMNQFISRQWDEAVRHHTRQVQDEPLDTPGPQRQAQPQNSFNPGTQSQHGVANSHNTRQPDTSSVPGCTNINPQAQPQPQPPTQLGNPDSYRAEQPNMSSVPGNTNFNPQARQFKSGVNTGPQAQYDPSSSHSTEQPNTSSVEAPRGSHSPPIKGETEQTWSRRRRRFIPSRNQQQQQKKKQEIEHYKGRPPFPSRKLGKDDDEQL